MLELTPGNLITHLRKLEDAGYLDKRDDRQRHRFMHLGRTHTPGPRALGTYTDTLRDLLGAL